MLVTISTKFQRTYKTSREGHDFEKNPGHKTSGFCSERSRPGKFLATKRPIFVLKDHNPKNSWPQNVPFLFRNAKRIMAPVEEKAIFAKTRPTLSSWFKISDANSQTLNFESEPQRAQNAQHSRFSCPCFFSHGNVGCCGFGPSSLADSATLAVTFVFSASSGQYRSVGFEWLCAAAYYCQCRSRASFKWLSSVSSRWRALCFCSFFSRLFCC